MTLTANRASRRDVLKTAAVFAPALITSAARAASSDIVLGRSLALSGPLKSYGQQKLDGADAYIEKVNRSGGINGRSVACVTLDDQYLGDKTAANLRQIAAQNSPLAYLGLFGVPCCAAALPVLQELRIPAVGLTSGADVLRNPFQPFAFPVRASYAAEAEKLANQIKTIGVSRFNIVFVDNPFGQSVRNSLVAALQTQGLKAGTLVALDMAGTNAAKAAAEALQGTPQAVFLCALTGAAVPFLREAKRIDSHPMLFTFSPIDTTILLREVHEAAYGLSITQVVPLPTDQRSQIAVEYVDAVKKLGRGEPSFYGMEAYLEAKVALEGVKRAGAGANPQQLVHALETMGAIDFGGFGIEYSKTRHQGGRYVDISFIDPAGRVRY